MNVQHEQSYVANYFDKVSVVEARIWWNLQVGEISENKWQALVPKIEANSFPSGGGFVDKRIRIGVVRDTRFYYATWFDVNFGVVLEILIGE